ncbi:hypothetical protein QJS10_CPA08g00130 [Acorus calamus]|uniref:Uncharacterized protein n=1 Tax=Acorus calamus TaxID=4465 RepID=A0AAV9E8V3_ACOCL|nr:hypothetical protein QJS10_CPA08g00130 [Acorus calamus]
MPELVILNEEKLRKLASLIYLQEAQAIQNIKFPSEPELAKYLRDCKSGYDSALSLLNAASESQQKWKDDQTRSPIALDIFDYVVVSVNYGLQTVRNYTLRINYLNKLSDHSKTLMDALNELDPENQTNVASLAKDVTLYKNSMIEYTKKYQSSASKDYSKWIKDTGLTFPDLVIRYQLELDYGGLFTDLLEKEKLEVYVKIIEASGRGKIVVEELSNAFEVLGSAVQVLTAGMMVWEIFSSEHVLQTVTRDAVVEAASVGGEMLGEIVGAAISTILVGVEAAPLFVLLAGVVTSIVGAFFLGEFAGWLVDLIFGSGGTAPLSTDGHRCYVSSMPDGEVLARQIAHQDN